MASQWAAWNFWDPRQDTLHGTNDRRALSPSSVCYSTHDPGGRSTFAFLVGFAYSKPPAEGSKRFGWGALQTNPVCALWPSLLRLLEPSPLCPQASAVRAWDWGKVRAEVSIVVATAARRQSRAQEMHCSENPHAGGLHKQWNPLGGADPKVSLNQTRRFEIKGKV